MAENTATEAAPAAAPAGSNAEQTTTNETLQPQPGTEGEDTKPKGIIESLMANPMMVVILVVLWIWVIWNMKKNKRRAQERKDNLNQINKGDKIVTIGRVHGTVVETDEKTFTIKPDSKKDYTLTFDREALLRVDNRPGENSSES